MSKATTSFDATTKTFYGDLFKQWGFTVETEREIFSHSRSIDLVVTCKNSEKNKLDKTLFSHFKELNAIEIKGYHDALTIKDFNKIMMRAWGLGAVNFNKDQESPPSRLPNQRTLSIICVTRPKKILDDLKSVFQFELTEHPGVYHAKGMLEVWLIHPTELSLCERNYPLLALARGKKLEQFIALCLKEGLTHYLELMLYIGFVTDPETIWQKILEVYQMRHVIHEETWPVIDEFFREVPNAMDKLTTFQDALMAKLFEGKQEGKQEGRQEGRQETLIRQLKLKFKIVPPDMIQIIKNTHDTDSLDYWLDRVIMAENIDEIDFKERNQSV